jgi:hypothetical protein
MSVLRAFVNDLLEAEGAAVDVIEPDGLDVLAPEPLRRVFGWQEDLTRLGFSAASPRGAARVGLEGDWLERFGALIGDRGRWAARQLPCPNAAAPSKPERLIERALDLPNAVWRLVDSRPTWTRCLLLAFRTTASSDEKRDGLIWLGFNLGTGAVLNGPVLDQLGRALAEEPAWHLLDVEAALAAGPPVLGCEDIALRIAPLLNHLVRDDLEPFLRSMRRRLERDRGRVYTFHNDLRQTALDKLAKLQNAATDKAAGDRKREALRVAAIEREYAAKSDDLRHKYALKINVKWTQGLLLLAPVQRYDIQIKRRKGERMIALDWHPAVRMMEAPLDEAGLGLDTSRHVCDENLHVTSATGQTCTSCGKAHCRACHPKACPRCAKV